LTKHNFSTCLKETLKWEGGYSNHPSDPGGSTNFGVTQARYNEYLKDEGRPSRTVKKITQAEVGSIYRKYYWDAVRGDELPSGVDLAVFDYGVNSGPYRSIKHLQDVLGLDQDGQLGPITMAAINKADPKALVKDLCDRRLRFVKGLGNLWKTFRRGWSRRIAGVKATALKMTNNEAPIPTPKNESPIEIFIKWVLSLLKS
jgi:lysozyme family protein